MRENQFFEHIYSGFTCPVEPSHVHHGFMVCQLYVFLSYHQFDLVPLLRLRGKKNKKKNIQQI